MDIFTSCSGNSNRLETSALALIDNNIDSRNLTETVTCAELLMMHEVE